MDQDEVLARMKAEIRARLQPVCGHMSEAMFEELVDKIAVTEKRSLQRNADKWGALQGKKPTLE